MIIDIYARVSTEDQAKHGLSIDTQLENLRAWARENGHTIAGEYVDAGISGKKPVSKRPALSRWISEIEAGRKVDALVFTKLDRFFRSVKLYYQATSIMDAHKIGWQAIQEDYETITSAGRFKVNIMLSIAEAEADRTGERIKVVFDRKVASGEYLGNKLPLGYSVVDKRLVPDENAEYVRGAFLAYLNTGSVAGATAYLHEHGINYIYHSVRDLLHNEVYTGRFRGNPGYCEPIISQEEYEEVQYWLARRSIKRNPSERIYIFSGLVFCAECGRSMIGTFRPRYRPEYHYRYRCNTHYSSHLCSNGHLVKESEIENILIQKVEQELALISSSVKQKKKPQKPKDNSKRIERLTELYIDGFITKEDYLAKREALETKPEPIKRESRLAELSITDFSETYHTLTREAKRALWKSIVDRVVTDGDSFTVFFRD